MKKTVSKALADSLQADLDALEALPDDRIDTSDIPERTDRSGAVRGLFYRPAGFPCETDGAARDIGTGDTREKQAVGELWERHSGGRGLFVVVEKEKDGKDMRAQLAAKIAPQATAVRKPAERQPER